LFYFPGATTLTLPETRRRKTRPGQSLTDTGVLNAAGTVRPAEWPLVALPLTSL